MLALPFDIGCAGCARCCFACGYISGSSRNRNVLHPGSVGYDPYKQTYTIRGSGAKMRLGKDDFITSGPKSLL
jgi:hypothetical protein